MKLNRRHFLALTAQLGFVWTFNPIHAISEELWKTWAESGDTVIHPAGVIKAADLQRANENLQRYDWAKKYRASIQRNVDAWDSKLTTEFLEQMIPDTTPGDSLFTPCPACRDQDKPYLPHGDWSWSPQRPEELKCNVCETVFPDSKYPENVVLHTHWGKPQTLTFMGGEPFPVFSYKQARPSMSGNIRARKVQWISTLVDNAAKAYALTGDLKYAAMTRQILLRLTDVYPYWLVHEGYGEYADMDPLIASQNINNLPEDELVYPPNKPDRKLITGYWSAGRAWATGMEGTFVRRVASAYDLTCTAKNADETPIYSTEERHNIEKNLLLESTKLLVADKQINNKSIGNRCAAGIVGMVVGEPELVRFGIEGFDKTINDWFLPDGGTPESSAYAMMTLGGTAEFVQALRQYSDPADYRDAEGKRYDKFDPYHDTNYGKVWEAMFNTLQGDLRYPPFADSYVTTAINASYAELMADNYPEKPQYLALLAGYIGGNWEKVYAPWALYYGEPGRETKKIPELKLPNLVLPDLRIGYMRTGKNGRDSLLSLSASHWGGHHHRDSLNLYYWKNNHELLTDLGYLWDHPQKQMTTRTLAHNTVMIDEKEQITTERGGDVVYFIDKPNVRAMRASSNAYVEAAVYERISVLIDHGGGVDYVVDVFWAQGGNTQDYIYHGPNQEMTIAATSSGINKIYDLQNVRQFSNKAGNPFKLTWKLSDEMQFDAWNIAAEKETLYVGDGWGQRDSKNKDRGTLIPYIVRRTTGKKLQTYASIFEGHAPNQPFVKKITPLRVEGNPRGTIALQIDTEKSRDYVIASHNSPQIIVRTPDGTIRSNSTLTIISMSGGKSTFSVTQGGKASINGEEISG